MCLYVCELVLILSMRASEIAKGAAGAGHSHRVSIFHPYIYTRSGNEREKESVRERSAPSGLGTFYHTASLSAVESGAPRLVCSIIILNISDYSACSSIAILKPRPECFALKNIS